MFFVLWFGPLTMQIAECVSGVQ